MDTATHLLTSLGVAALGQNIPYIAEEDTRKAVLWSAIIGSQAPDLDILYRVKGDLSYLAFHRGVSHSLPSLIIIPLLVTLLLRLFFPRLSKGIVFIVAFASTLLHIFLDVLTSYGTLALWPLSNQRLGWDILMIIDPFILLVCAIAIWIGRKGLQSPTRVFTTMFGVIALYILLRTGIHHRALTLVEAQYPGNSPRKVSVLPGFGLNTWAFVVDPQDDQGTVILGAVNFIKGKVIEKERHHKISSPVVEAAEKSPAGRVFTNFARHPLAMVKGTSKGYEVTWIDLRYHYTGRNPFTAHARLDKDLQVVDSGIGEVVYGQK